MSRILKITISAAMQCLAEAGISSPDAIITGTGRGAVADMEQFVKDMIRLEEGALNPTLFIQSTYNSANGWIAMQSTSNGYNQTYVHRGCSFELAVQDAQMLAAETPGPLSVLAGAYDEMTEEYFIIRGKREYWKEDPPLSDLLFHHADTPGTIGGEGAAFFMLGNQPGNAAASILDLEIIYAATAEAVRDRVSGILKSAGLEPGDISLILTGMNGDVHQTGLYNSALALFPAETPVAGFKHLCGEYDTASAFGLWLADHLFRSGKVPPEMLLKNGPPAGLNHVLLINHYILGTASLWLLTGLKSFVSNNY